MVRSRPFCLDVFLAAAFYVLLLALRATKNSSSCTPRKIGRHDGTTTPKGVHQPVDLLTSQRWVRDIRSRALSEKTFWRGYIPFCPPALGTEPDVALMESIGAAHGSVPFVDHAGEDSDATNTAGSASGSRTTSNSQDETTTDTRTPVRQQQMIPKVVHKIFFLPAAGSTTPSPEDAFRRSAQYAIARGALPTKLQAAFASWEGELNPDHHIRFWNERDVRRFLRTEYDQELLDVFDTIIPESWRSNLARFAIVGKLGGWYSDIQTVLLKSVREFSCTDDCSPGGSIVREGDRGKGDFDLPLFFCDRGLPWLQAAVFRAPANHPWLLRAVDIIKKYVLSRTYGNSPHMTGPLALGQAAKLEGCCSKFGPGSLDLGRWRRPKIGFFVNHRDQKHGNGFAFAKGAPTAAGKTTKDKDAAARALTDPVILYKYTKFLSKSELSEREAKPYPENSYWQFFRDQNAYRTKAELVEYQRTLDQLEERFGL